MTAREEAFIAFHDANPDVYAAMCHFARQWRRSGRQRIGVDMLLGRVRWEMSIVTHRVDEFKISNDHKPFYARLIMYQEPDLDGVFVLKKAEASGADEFIARLRAADRS